MEREAPVVSRVSAPSGTEAFAVQWVRIAATGDRSMLAAVARPVGDGPFPSVLLLHGSHDFAQEYVQLAQELAKGGLLAMTACWFQGGRGADVRFISPISCPEAPPMPEAPSPEAMRTVGSLVQAARALPGVRPDRIGLFGHSRGGGAALTYGLKVGDVQAVVLNSTGYPAEFSALVSEAKPPILMLHGTADNPDDGGSAATHVGYPFKAGRFGVGRVLYGAKFKHEFSHPTEDRPP